MIAALLEPGRSELVVVDDVEVDSPRPGQVVVDVHHCGLCHSDVSIVNGQYPNPMPVVLGHEAAGVVAEVGAGVASVAPGDKVLMSPLQACGRCYFCVRGETSICQNMSVALVAHAFPDGTTGLSRGSQPVGRGLGVGGFAEQAITLESGVVRLDPDTPLEIVSVIGCAVQTGVGAVLNTANVEAGATVLVMGLGGIGISIVQGARIAGASRIVVSDPVGERRDAAERFGATDAIDPTVDDVVGRCLAITGGIGVDFAFDAAGSARLVETGFHATRPGGTTVAVGAGPAEETLSGISAIGLMFGEKKLKGCLLGSVNSQRDVPRLVSLWRAGRLDLEGMVTKHRPLAEVNDAIADLQSGIGLRTLLSPLPR
jgi:S-(hydroxymethyl)glutathione dehydrogenase/alcohol dehydrogenase